jgi:long-chain acyl-CoA synthetase
MPERTAKAIDKGGWFHTGDVGSIDDDGFVWVTGRISRTIVLSSGKKIAPEELEAKLLSLPGVLETIVSGDGATREVVATIYSESPEADIRREVGDLNKGLPVYKRISRVEIRTTPFPKTASGKIKLNPPDEMQTR